MGLAERIADIEKEVARTQVNKATNYHLGLLRGKLAQLRTQVIEGEAKANASKPGEGFDVSMHGSARVAMIGFPSVGKSSFLNLVTNQESEAAAYEFTTLTCIPGKLFINGAEV
jgi:ribosome-interacting GTPase 1